MDRSLRFTERVAEDLMVPRVRVVALPADATVQDLIETAVPHRPLPVPGVRRDLDDVRGVVHVKQAFQVDLARARQGAARHAGPTGADRAGEHGR